VAAPPRPKRTTTAFDRVRALPDHRLLDSLLRSSAWIWVIGLALGGIVAMQVSLLKLNAGIGRAVEATATLERQNTELEARVARLSAGQRIEDTATQGGMVMPPAGAVEYVRVRPGTDARWAAERMEAPSPAARALMANGGVVPGSLANPGATPEEAAAAAATTVAVPGTANITAPAAGTAPTAAPTTPATPPPATAVPGQG